MKRRDFLKLPLAGAVAVPAYAMAAELCVPEDELQVVEAWAAPPAYVDPHKIELIATFPSRIISMTTFRDMIIVATDNGVYQMTQEWPSGQMIARKA